MKQKPDRTSTAGNRYLDLRKLARSTQRPTDELLQLYALEGFLDRLNLSAHANDFVLKGGMLLSAYNSRRPTKDIDFSVTNLNNETDDILQIITTILTNPNDDGLEFNTKEIVVEPIRQEEIYNSLRVKLKCSLLTAKIFFHIDINTGDPIWPPATRVEVPRILGGEPIPLDGYSIEMILAEKLVTTIQRGIANTRWRDFVDINSLSKENFDTITLTKAITKVAEHRNTTIELLSVQLKEYPSLAQQQWQAWRRKQQLTDTTPESFKDLLEEIFRTYDPILKPLITASSND